MAVTISKALSVGQASEYYKQEFANNDYYSQDGETIGEWSGEGAVQLGLQGGVEYEQFVNTLGGYDPSGDNQLVSATKNKDAKIKRRAGYDIVFAAPKSVSLTALCHENPEIREQVKAAHNRAVKVALSEMEKYTQTRINGVRVDSKNLVVAKFDHDANRNLEPHLHTHCVAVNMTKRHDGEWRAIEPKELYASQKYADSIYMSEMATEIKNDIGLDLEYRKGAHFEIAGFTQEQIDSQSTRRQELLESARKRAKGNKVTAIDLERGQKDTRKNKEHVPFDELQESWIQDLKAVGVDFSKIQPKIPEPDPEYVQAVGKNSEIPKTPEISDNVNYSAMALNYSLKHNTERKSVIDQRNIMADALNRQQGNTDIKDVQDELKRRIKGGDVLVVSDRGLTTKEVLKAEKNIDQIIKEGRGKLNYVTEASRTVLEETANKKFGKNIESKDQRNAYVHILKNKDQFSSLYGKAGTGKTYLIEKTKEEIEKAGYKVKGFAPITGASKLLEEAGLESKTVQHLIMNPNMERGKQFWFVDESGLISAKQFEAVLEKAKKMNARVCFVGDPLQHQSVAGGTPYDHLIDKNLINNVTLNEIRRQDVNKAAPELKSQVYALKSAALEASNGKADEAVKILNADGKINEIKDRDERHRVIAKLYLESPDSTIVIVPPNIERAHLNAVIHEERGLTGGFEKDILVNRGLTGEGRTFARNYQEGDVVRYNSGMQAGPLRKGVYATVRGVDAEKNTITVSVEEKGKPVQLATYDPRRLKGVDVYEKKQVEFSLGERVQFNEPFKRKAVANRQIGTITKIDQNGYHVKLDGEDRTIKVFKGYQHIDYGYAVTSYSSQGKAFDRTIVDLHTEQSKELVNNAQFYVSITRAKYETIIYTDNIEKLPGVVSRGQDLKRAQESLEERHKEVLDIKVAVGQTGPVVPLNEDQKGYRNKNVSTPDVQNYQKDHEIQTNKTDIRIDAKVDIPFENNESHINNSSSYSKSKDVKPVNKGIEYKPFDSPTTENPSFEMGMSKDLQEMPDHFKEFQEATKNVDYKYIPEDVEMNETRPQDIRYKNEKLQEYKQAEKPGVKVDKNVDKQIEQKESYRNKKVLTPDNQVEKVDNKVSSSYSKSKDVKPVNKGIEYKPFDSPTTENPSFEMGMSKDLQEMPDHFKEFQEATKNVDYKYIPEDVEMNETRPQDIRYKNEKLQEYKQAEKPGVKVDKNVDKQIEQKESYRNKKVLTPDNQVEKVDNKVSSSYSQEARPSKHGFDRMPSELPTTENPSFEIMEMSKNMPEMPEHFKEALNTLRNYEYKYIPVEIEDVQINNQPGAIEMKGKEKFKQPVKPVQPVQTDNKQNFKAQKARSMKDEIYRITHDIDLVEFAKSKYGFTADHDRANRSTASSVILKGEGNYYVFVQKGGKFGYASPKTEEKGDIINFVANRTGRDAGNKEDFKEIINELKPYVGVYEQKAGLNTEANQRSGVKEAQEKNLDNIKTKFDGMKNLQYSKYLESRGITKKIINAERFKGRIKVDSYSNAVFPQYSDKGVIGLEKRNQNFKGFDGEGHKSIWISNHSKADKGVIIAEAPIDALSYHQIHKDLTKDGYSYVSIGGGWSKHTEKALTQVIKAHEGRNIVMVYDNDKMGEKYIEKTQEIIKKVAPNAKVNVHVSQRDKDWNEELKLKTGIKDTPSKDFKPFIIQKPTKPQQKPEPPRPQPKIKMKRGR